MSHTCQIHGLISECAECMTEFHRKLRESKESNECLEYDCDCIQMLDHEPEQAQGTAEDLRKHEQYGGTKDDYL